MQTDADRYNIRLKEASAWGIKTYDEMPPYFHKYISAQKISMFKQYWEGKSYASIAKAHNVSTTTVLSMIRYMRDCFKLFREDFSQLDVPYKVYRSLCRIASWRDSQLTLEKLAEMTQQEILEYKEIGDWSLKHIVYALHALGYRKCL